MNVLCQENLNFLNLQKVNLHKKKWQKRNKKINFIQKQITQKITVTFLLHSIIL